MAMWGEEPQLALVRERLKLLLAAHAESITPMELEVDADQLLLQQGNPADRILLLTEGSVAIQLRPQHQEQAPHTLAVVTAEAILGEMGLFGNGRHGADVRVINGPARLISVASDQLLQAMLFDADLAMELLALISSRCLRCNQVVGQLLDGIRAAHRGDDALLASASTALRTNTHSLAEAADQLEQLSR